MERMVRHTRQPEVLREIFAALGNDPYVIAECLARPALADRLARNLYAHDERFHGDLKRRAEAELAAHQSVQQMRQTSGTYGEIEWAKSDDESGIVGQSRKLSGLPKDGLAPASQPNTQSAGEAALQRLQEEKNVLKLTGSEWAENVQKLGVMFATAKTARARPQPARHGEGAPSPQKDNETLDAWGQIKTGVLSALQEDNDHYYATAVITKGTDRLKLATIAWMKQPFDSWRAKAETRLPVTMAAPITAN